MFYKAYLTKTILNETGYQFPTFTSPLGAFATPVTTVTMLIIALFVPAIMYKYITSNTDNPAKKTYKKPLIAAITILASLTMLNMAELKLYSIISINYQYKTLEKVYSQGKTLYEKFPTISKQAGKCAIGNGHYQNFTINLKNGETATIFTPKMKDNTKIQETLANINGKTNSINEAQKLAENISPWLFITNNTNTIDPCNK